MFNKVVVVIAQLLTTGPFAHIVPEEDRLQIAVMVVPIHVTAVRQ